jgi:hypothetical protein
MGIYIVVENSTGLIDNRIVLDDPGAWEVPEGHSIFEETGAPMQIGGTYAGGVYTPPAPPPLPPPPEQPPPDANARIDAGITAAILAAEEVRNGVHAIPSAFNAANFQLFLTQAKILSDAFLAMLQAQQTPPPP